MNVMEKSQGDRSVLLWIEIADTRGLARQIGKLKEYVCIIILDTVR